MRTRSHFSRLSLVFAALALTLVLPLRAEDHEALGRAALAKADYPAAVEHLEAASRELEGGDREKLAQIQTDLGIAYLTGLDRPADALRAFVRAADLSANPASAWLWASTAALQMGDEGESDRYKRLALGVKRVPKAAEPANAEAEGTVPAMALEPVPHAPEPVVAEAPKSEAPAAPTPKPAAAPEPETPSAFGHFFGGKGKTGEPAGADEKVEAPPAAAKKKDLKDSKDGKDGKDEKKKPEAAPAAEPEAAPETQAPGSAFDHFFKRKPADEPQEPQPSEPPPSGVSGRS